MDITRVLAPNPSQMTLGGTNSYILSDGDGQLAVVDPGPDDPGHIQALLDAVDRLGRLVSVLVTHRHHDHLPAALPLCERTGAVLVGHPDLPGVQRPVQDGQVVFGALVALSTPGHTRESLTFWDPPSRALFTGDLMAGSGTVVVDDQPGALTDYLASLERLAALEPRAIYPGHGPRVDDAPARIREYLAHRRQRVQQVIDQLAATPTATVDDLVAAIYPTLQPTLVPQAARNVRANLDVLEREGRVAPVEGERWRLTT